MVNVAEGLIVTHQLLETIVVCVFVGLGGPPGAKPFRQAEMDNVEHFAVCQMFQC